MSRYLSQTALFLLVSFFVAACASPPVVLPPGTLNADEVLTLFSDKTVTSVTISKKRESISYYDPNGEIRQLRDGQKRNGTWRVTKNGRICLKFGAKEKCRILVKENGEYRKYVVKDDGQHRAVVDYSSFISGNPRKL